MNKSEDGFRFKLNKHLVGYYTTVRAEIALEAPESLINWNIPPPQPLRHQGPLLQLDGVYFTYPNSSKQILRNVSLSISPNSRIGFVGANGDGKSTLLGLLAGTLEPTRGMVNRHPQMKFGYFNQNHVNSLNLEISAIAYMKQYFSEKSNSPTTALNVNDQTVRQHLGKFGISGDVALKKLKYLSGGQKSRVAFALQVFPTSPNLLILDEITNHLDMATNEAIARILGGFEGAVVTVSHDRWFMENVANEVYVVKRGNVKLLEGGIDDYVTDIAKEIGVDIEDFS